MRRSSSLQNVDTYVQRKVDSDKFDDLNVVADHIDAVVAVAENIDAITDPDNMKKSVYDTNNDGKVDTAEVAETAHKWTTARTLTVSGSATGSVAFDGSGDVSLNLSIADNSHNHVLSNISDLDDLVVDGGNY